MGIGELNPRLLEMAVADVVLMMSLREAVSSFVVRMYPVLRSCSDGCRYVMAGERFSEIFPAIEKASKQGETVLEVDWGSKAGKVEYPVGVFFDEDGSLPKKTVLCMILVMVPGFLLGCQKGF